MKNQQIMLCEGLDRAFLGLTREWSGHVRAVYDYDRAVKVFMDRDGMTSEEATEFMDFNVVGAFVGEATPLWVNRMRLLILMRFTPLWVNRMRIKSLRRRAEEES